MFKEVRKKYGRLDVLINNAGVASKVIVVCPAECRPSSLVSISRIDICDMITSVSADVFSVMM